MLCATRSSPDSYVRTHSYDVASGFAVLVSVYVLGINAAKPDTTAVTITGAFRQAVSVVQ